MTKKAWFMSLFLPVLSILGSMLFVIMYLTDSAFPVFIGIFALAAGGILPVVLVIRNRLDLSAYFPVKIILFAVLAVGSVILWTFALFSAVLILSGLMIIAEIAFAVLQKTDKITKLCLALSSLAWGSLGFCLEMIRALYALT